MVHHVVLYKLKPEVTPARVEAMMMNTRMQLLKIPEVLNIKCGKRIDPELPWPFFIAIDFESMDKYAIFREDPIFVKFMEEVALRAGFITESQLAAIIDRLPKGEYRDYLRMVCDEGPNAGPKPVA